MAKSTSPRKADDTASAMAPRGKPDPRLESLIERLARARSANEITSVIGLKPIKGRSGPKIAY
ncbi:hypothetical protein RM190_04580 [Paracoccus sp. CPCC 101403]|uniref:Uncharacterized protein n=2 Tax=Paracoccus broussonetiae TaxID=3075834 RepID=A0ABU3EA79_9RHOB|nr:hypothetical protein [Paracoccus sp. CPCC 101403]MDT1061124.1 hypothetical protein [Paracoccus sp. CPCC 101403]